MLGNLVESLAGFMGTIKKSSVELYTNAIFKCINDTILPVFEEITNTSKNKAEIKQIKENKQLALFSKLSGIQQDNFKTLEKMHTTFKNLSKSEGDVKKVIDFHFPKLMVNNVVRARDAALVKLLEDLNAFNMYTVDFLYYILMDPTETLIPKIKVKRIHEKLGDYVTLYKVYSKPLEPLLIKIAKMSDEEIPSKLDKTLLELKEVQLTKHGEFPNLPYNGFIGNPIYHIRMWLIDRDFRKIEVLEDKKQLIELRLMELKLEAQGQRDPNLTKQIRYYEDKLSGIEYDIEKLQK